MPSNLKRRLMNGGGGSGKAPRPRSDWQHEIIREWREREEAGDDEHPSYGDLREMNPTARNELLSSPRVEQRQFEQALRDLAGVSKQAAAAIASSFPYGQGLENTSVNVLRELGATEAQARRIKSAFGFVRMCDASCQKRGRMITGPTAASAEILTALQRAIGSRDQEFFVVVLLDARQRVIDVFGSAVGTLSRVEIHPREVFKHAIQANAHAIVVAHNHPSGDATPSDGDVQMTKRMVEAGRLNGIPVLDSIVITPSGNYTSFAELGLIEQD